MLISPSIKPIFSGMGNQKQPYSIFDRFHAKIYKRQEPVDIKVLPGWLPSVIRMVAKCNTHATIYAQTFRWDQLNPILLPYIRTVSLYFQNIPENELQGNFVAFFSYFHTSSSWYTRRMRKAPHDENSAIVG